MSTESSACPSTAVPFSEAVRRCATSPFLASLPQPFPGVDDYMNHFPKGMNVAEREAMACLRRDLAKGLARSWGRAGSPYTPMSPIPGEAWRHLRPTDWGQEKFGLSREQPETFVWNVRVDLLATVDRGINEFEYLDTAASAVALLCGIPLKHAETVVLTAVYLGHSNMPSSAARDLQEPAGHTEPADRQVQSLDVGAPVPDEGSTGSAPPVRLAVWRTDRFVPYVNPIARPGDIAVPLSRIIPAYDKLQDARDFTVELAFSNAEVVLINTQDLVNFCQYDGVLGRGENYRARACGTARSTVAAETRCYRWLLDLMSTSDPIKDKAAYYEEARERFELFSRCSFDRAWGRAAADSGNDIWTRPGPKGRSPRSSGEDPCTNRS